MILRIEKHFKAEQAARKKAEELLQQSIAAELDAKNQLEDVLKKRGGEHRALEDERVKITRERNQLESMRQDFENELQAARNEVAKAQDALAGSEERIRNAEQVCACRLNVGGGSGAEGGRGVVVAIVGERVGMWRIVGLLTCGDRALDVIWFVT